MGPEPDRQCPARRSGRARRLKRHTLARPPRRKTSGLPSDADLERALALCGVAHLASRLDDEQDWSQLLSLDEQKRLAFARLLVQRPDIVFLDETTADLDNESALSLYRLLRAELPRAMVITIGHANPLQQVHDARLDLRALRGAELS